MTYKEFEKWCTENGYVCDYSNKCLKVYDDGFKVLDVAINAMYSLGSDWTSSTPKELFEKAVELASTPLGERIDQKLYHVILPTSKDSFEALSKDLGIIHMYGYHDDDLKLDRFRFTEKQIKAIDERYMAFAEEVE